ncbi:MAG: hypothetical protein PHX43_01765 [Alphaproteobacteria bacterium]|nr:hypothetical protein [Alphaproteobacteria bacterium]
MSCIRTAVFMACLFCSVSAARAGDLPVADGSPLAGIAFDDKPLLLPVQRNFQMAMLTASSEIGRGCGAMEAYGWRLNQNEQDRVNQIFNSAVDRMRAQGFAVETRKPNSVARDITMFTADSPEQHLLFMWSAGDIGLVMVLCETSAPIGGRLGQITENAPDTSQPPHGVLGPTIQRFNESLSVASKGSPITRPRRAEPAVHVMQSPLGDWVGSYSCEQGATGGKLSIKSIKGDRFDGVFRFYPTANNPYVPSGSYKVSGEYDSDAQRILINPGKWIQRPANYFNTVMVGSFDAAANTFSGYFQGITGCTSFEARYVPGSSANVAKAVVKKRAVKKKAVNKPEVKVEEIRSDIKVGGDSLTAPPVVAPLVAAPAKEAAPIETPKAAETLPSTATK